MGLTVGFSTKRKTTPRDCAVLQVGIINACAAVISSHPECRRHTYASRDRPESKHSCENSEVAAHNRSCLLSCKHKCAVSAPRTCPLLHQSVGQ